MSENNRCIVEYLTRREAAAYLRISVRLLDKKAAEGEIPYHKLGKGPNCRVLFNFTDLKKYVEKCRVEL
ncbi:MAG: excisionase family DNA-binding protein [Candidatus Omnitrophica bacterium]|nr:excisionase family DNA-binding protein [Candidatus Omnitrophota bacterium]